MILYGFTGLHKIKIALGVFPWGKIKKRQFYGGKIMEEKKYCIYSFKGVTQYLCKGSVLKNMSLEKCLKDVFNTWYDNDTKKLFNRKEFVFEAENYTMETIRQKITEGMSIFPVSENTDISIVKNYIALGLSPVFMKGGDFRTFKKDYKEYM